MNKFKQEYIGSNIMIIKSKNNSLKGLKGIVLNETKNSFKVKTSSGVKTILKNVSTFKINGNVIEGNKIVKKPHERIKMKV